jgi:hypothetical protein
MFVKANAFQVDEKKKNGVPEVLFSFVLDSITW